VKLIEFTDFLDELYEFFRYKEPPKNEIIQKWLIETEFIASEALPWILADLKATQKTIPRNFTITLRQQWFKYLDAHPDKQAKAEESPDYDCPDCHGVGCLHFSAQDLSGQEDKEYVYVAICASCRASWSRFGKILHEGGKICRKSDSGAWIPDGAYIPPMMRLTKAELLNRGYEFMEAENKFAKRLEIPDAELTTDELPFF
jgi:hypothetical protein